MSDQPSHYVGLDLGPPGEPTGLAILERPFTEFGEPIYKLRHLQRFPPGTSYPAIVAGVGERTASEELDCPTMIVDQTGVGSLLIEELKRHPSVPSLTTVTITAGTVIQEADDRSMLVPKKELVTAMQLILQNRRLKVPVDLPDGNMFLRELSDFRIRAVRLDDAPLAWREGRQDDLVLAVALTVWYAERHPTVRWEPDTFGYGGSIIDNAPEGVFLT